MKKHCEHCGKPIADFLRSTKKYCNDTCRRYAFYSRQGIAPEKNDGELTPRKLALNGTPELALNANEPLPLNVKDLPLNAKQEVKPADASETSTEENKKDPPPPYKWVESPLINAIDRYRMQSSAEEMFAAPHYYWTTSMIARVRWVTLRLRCLVENILRLGSFRAVDRTTIRELSRAFDQMTEAAFFRDLPRNYPYTELIEDLRDKFRDLLNDSEADEISLRLSTERRAQLIVTKFMMGGFVPKVSFSSLDFTDGTQRPQETGASDEDDEDNEETED